MKTSLAAAALLCLAFAGQPAAGAAADTSVRNAFASIGREWQAIQFRAPPDAREPQLAALADKAHEIAEHYPQAAAAHIWQGIVLASWAAAKGGMPGLKLARQAKAEYEAALQISPQAMRGAAQSGLGILYYRVPRWPLGFGSDAKAEAMFKQALAIDPDGLSPNYYYACFLMARKRYADAVPVLEAALKAPPSPPGAEIIDQTHRAAARKLLDEASGKAGAS